MRLFWQEHIPLILLHIVQLFMVLFVYWLAGFQDIKLGLYSVFIGLFILGCYLVYKYASHRSFYERLSEPLPTLDDSIRNTSHAPIPTAFDELLKMQYQHYQQQLTKWERERNEHLAFMNQWVHQMKTPLSVMELLLQNEEDISRESLREELDKIHKGLDTVLYTARLSSFQQDFRVEPVSLWSVADQLVHENKRYFIQNRVYPEILIDQSIQVYSDRKWLSFALSQVLINAIKYSKGTGQKVTMSAAVKGETVVMEIKDRGVGIPASDLERVFQPFFTGENGRKFSESTGMGLYLVAEIFKRLDHGIELESEPGKGTVVRLSFSIPPHNLT